MKCFDCDAEGRANEAVAVCAGCGAGVCAVHAAISTRPLRRTNGVGVTTLRRSARLLHCPACAAARSDG